LAVECDKLEGKVADSLCEQPSNLEMDKKDHYYQAYCKGADECNKRCLGDEGAESQGDWMTERRETDAGKEDGVRRR
jgi:hypothetical protein